MSPGAVRPKGWLLDWARAAANGITGHLDEYSATFANAWKGFGFKARGANPDGTGWPLEQSSYWLDGAVRLAYQLNDPKLLEKVQARLNLVADGVLKGGASFIYWRPKSALSDHFNCWAHSHMGRALVAYYQASHDQRVLDALAKVYRAFPLPAYPDNFRSVTGAVNVDPMLDTYLLTGEPKILAAISAYAQSPEYERVRTAFAGRRLSPGHTVIYYENIRVPALLYPWTGNALDLSATVNALEHCDRLYGLPVGLCSGEEWQAGIGSTRNIETCDVAASLWTYLSLLRVTGRPQWSERIERIFFNAAPAPVSRDFKIMSYYQCVNRYSSKLPGAEPRNPGPGCYRFTRLGYPPVLCCVGNLNRLIPTYTMHMWMRTPDHGLAAALYGPSLLSTTIPGKGPVEIESRTSYPFEEFIDLYLTSERPVTFPLYLRIPSWCERPEIAVNGERIAITRAESGFVRLNREWSKQKITIRLPMHPRVQTGRETPYPQVDYFKNERPIAALTDIDNPFAYVTYGPLVFSCPIRDETPNQESPGQVFNYALFEKAGPLSPSDFSVVRRPMPEHWDWPLASPLELHVKARRFDWQPSDLQPIPKRTIERGSPATASLIPYGCTKFRVTMFPILGI
ncbi:MAG TPA: beta-L-arabinofuranosidase domain-containing protein [Bryobacteraceae bacterium]